VGYAYYPGCSLHGTAKEYDMSSRACLDFLGIQYRELPDWSCCGASSAHSVDHTLAVSLPARNLTLAEQMNLPLMTPCAACYSRLRGAHHALRSDPGLAKKVLTVLGSEYKGRYEPLSILDVLYQYGPEAVGEKVTKKLKELRVACYYGCLLLRPPDYAKFDDPENPGKMERLVETTGASAVDWPHRTECCGASLSLSDTKLVVSLATSIVDMAVRHGAECIVTACPMCQANLDMRQRGRTKLPVYYVTELLGLAFGLEPKRLGLTTHMVNAISLLRAKQLA